MEQFEKGTKFYSGITPVLDLSGTWREMGRQYGALLSAELKDMYDRAVCGKLFGEYGCIEEDALASARKLFNSYPFRFKDFFAGMEETSGLTLDQLKLVNAVEFVSFSNGLLSGCSGVAVWGDYAQNGLVFGRNYDYCDWLKDFAKDFVFTAFHPADGSLAVLTASYAGEIYVVNGLNEKGIFLELNNGAFSGGTLRFENRKSAVAELFECLLDVSTLDEVDAFFQTVKSSFAYLIGVSDGQIARCYEWPTFGVELRKTHTRPGLIVLTNHFTEPSWGLPRPNDEKSFKTVERRDNLLTLAKHFKGSIDVETMKGIMDTKLENGGSKLDATVYQLVAEPGKLHIWFKVSDAQDWTLLDAKPLLRPRQA